MTNLYRVEARQLYQFFHRRVWDQVTRWLLQVHSIPPCTRSRPLLTGVGRRYNYIARSDVWSIHSNDFRPLPINFGQIKLCAASMKKTAKWMNQITEKCQSKNLESKYHNKMFFNRTFCYHILILTTERFLPPELITVTIIPSCRDLFL